MKKLGILVFVTALVIGIVFSNLSNWGKASGKIAKISFDFGRVNGSGTLASEKREVPAFSRLDVSGVFHVDVVSGSEFSVEVEADDNLLEYIKTEVSGNELEISLEKGVKSKNTLRVRVTAPNIEALQASGASRVSISNLKNAAITVDCSGASKVELLGETGKLEVEMSGASNVNAASLRVASAKVEASGASRANLNVLNDLLVDASGASKVVYTGSPKVQQNTSGAASVSQN